MANLTDKKIKDTYEGLLKTNDNAAIDGAVEITDGAGNGTGVTISNDGQVTATGTVSFGSLKDTGENITITKFVDEADGISLNDNDTTIPTSAAVKDYVDTNVTAQDLDFQGDTGTGAVDLDSQTLDIAGGTGIDTSASGQTLTVNIDSTVATLSDTQTLTNKTIDADNNTVSNLEVDNLKSGVLDTDLTSVSVSDDTLASAKAIKTYVDSNITAQDLDITDGTTTSAVDLDSQTLTIQGTTNEVEVGLTGQTFTVGLPTSITTNLTGNADTASALQTARTISLSGDVAGSVSFDGSANADITATIQANSVALGTDTTGDYVSGLGTGTGVTIGSNTGEGSSPTISVDYGSTANTAVQGNTSLTIQGTANEIEVTGGGVTLGSGGTVTVGLPDDVSLGGSLTIAQNLTVNGTTTTVNTDTLSVEDPLIELARDNSENSVDVGLYGKYSLDSGVTTKYSGLFKDASDSDKFKLFKGLEVEPTSTVDTSGTGYTKGDLVINDLDAVTISGTISTAAQTNITSVGTLSSLAVSGDLTVDTNTLYVDAAANSVGFGTSSPNTSFSIDAVKPIRAENFTLRSNSTAPSESAFIYRPATGVLGFGTANTERMRIDSSGNVGIGTSPSYKLHVSGSTNEIAGFTSSATTTALRIENTHTNGWGSNLQFWTLGTAAGFFGTIGSLLGSTDQDLATYATTGNGIRFYTNGNNERMRIDSSGNVGIGTSSPSSLLEVFDSNSIGLRFGDIASTPSSQTAGYIGMSTSAYSGNNGDLVLIPRTSSASNILLMEGNVGIGTSSPSAKLDVNGDIKLSAGAKIKFNDDRYFTPENNVDGAEISANGIFKVKTGTTPTERFRIDSSGNVGIGTSSPTADLSVGSTSTSSGDVHLRTTKTTFSMTPSNTDAGGMFLDVGWASGGQGPFRFGIGGSEKMRIDSSGNVGIGTSSPSSKAHIIDTSNPDTTSGSLIVEGRRDGGANVLTLRAKDASNPSDALPNGQGAVMRFQGFDGTDFENMGYIFMGADGQAVANSDAPSFMSFGTSADGSSSPSERMRITSGGEVQIGTAGTSSGAPTYKGKIRMAKASEFESNIEFITTDFSSGYGWSIGSHDQSGGVIDLNFYSRANSATFTKRFLIEANGNVKSSTGSYGTISSDERLKENILDATSKLEDILSLNVKNYNYIGEDSKQIGFIAQEFEQVFPSLVTERDTRKYDEEGNVISGYEDTKGLKVGMEFAILVKAIQEQQDIINELKTRIETLENN